MSLLARLLVWLYPDPPATAQRRRRLRATCECCGKDLAVIASTGKLWKHDCVTPDYGPAPGPMDPHDRIDELEMDDDGR